MARRSVVVSDLSGNIVEDDQHVSIKVLDAPTIEHPVRLDASEAEIKSLGATASDFAVIEVLRQGAAPDRLVVEWAKFEKLFKVDVQEALEGAERVSEGGAPKGRGRPRGAGSVKPKSDKIDYASVDHSAVPHRGRITENEKATVRANFEVINARLERDGIRTLDLANPEHVTKYGLEVLRDNSPQFKTGK